MAITQTVTSITARPVLNNGTDSSGNVRTVNGSFGATLAPSEFTDDKDLASAEKLLNIANALGECLALTIYNCTKTVTKSISSD